MSTFKMIDKLLIDKLYDTFTNMRLQTEYASEIHTKFISIMEDHSAQVKTDIFHEIINQMIERFNFDFAGAEVQLPT